MNKSTLATAIIMLSVGVGVGYILFDYENNNTLTTVNAPQQQGAAAGKETPLFYRNAMNPTVTSPVPAKDSMGMDYVPVYAEEKDSNAVMGTVKIDPTVVQNIGVRTSFAKQESMSRKWRVYTLKLKAGLKQ